MNNEHPALSGWNSHFEDQYNKIIIENPGLIPGRVLEVQRDIYRIHDGTRDLNGVLTGRFYQGIERASELPVTGDWVLFRSSGDDLAVINRVLERKTILSRRKPGAALMEQPIAANIDIMFIVQGLDCDYNLRRLERYLLLCAGSGIRPVVLFNKCDLSASGGFDPDTVQSVTGDIPFHLVSAHDKTGFACFDDYMKPGITAVFAGSSGAGKSSIINVLLNEERQSVREVRADDSRGRHTTTGRSLFILPGGGMVIDTPGMRELEPWDAADDMDSIFADIKRLALDCRFKDCTHSGEPGCAVTGAVSEGRLGPDRLRSWHKLLREQEYQRFRADEGADFERRRKEKKFKKECRKIMSEKNKTRDSG